MADSLGVLGSISVRFIAEVADFARDLTAAADAAKASGDQITDMFKNVTAIGKDMALMGASLTAAITVPLALIGKESFEAAAEMDGLMKGLTAVAGGSKQAGEQLKGLKDVAKLPGLGLEEAIKGSINLQAVGVSAKEAERDLKAIGNAIATVGGSRADLTAVITQLRQMSSGTKVLSADLKPMMERIPQLAGVVKEAYGTIDTEVIGKAGISSKEFIETAISGLERLPPVAGGVGNALENLKDSWKAVEIALGNLIIPLGEQLIPILASVIETITEVVEWFKTLPGPIQGALGAVVAFAAAIGPAQTALGGILAVGPKVAAMVVELATFWEVSVVAALGWAAAIGVVVAALGALAVWVYDNWEPVTAVLKQAWEGISELWANEWNGVTTTLTKIWDGISASAELVFGPLLNFLSVIWDAVGPYFVSAWNGIASFLSGVWGAIKNDAYAVWNGIVGAFQTFIEWAGKIPGAAKLINLDEAWKSAQKLKQETEKAAEGIKTVGTQAKTTGAKIDALALAHDKAKKKTKEHHEAVKGFTLDHTVLGESIKQATDEYNKNVAAVVKWLREHKEWNTVGPKYLETTKELDAAIQNYAGSIELSTAALKRAGELQALVFGDITTKAKDAIKPVQDLDAAYKALGITQSTSSKQGADDAIAAYEKIKLSGTATAGDIDRAWVAMEEKRIQAMKDAGETIPRETEAALKKAKDKLDGHKGDWDVWTKQVSTIVTDFGKDVASSLWDGDLSFSEKGMKALKALGEAGTRFFVEPLTKSIDDMLKGIFTDLLGGKGFGGIMDSLKGIGSALGSIFGGGAGAAASTTNLGGYWGAITGGGNAAAGAATSGTSAASGIVGAGLSATLGAVFAGVGAASGVWSNFQNIQMEKGINAIEDSTRYLKIGLVTQGDSLLNDSHMIRNFLHNAEQNYWATTVPSMRDVMEKLEKLDPIRSSASAIADRLTQLHERLVEISTNTYDTWSAADAIKGFVSDMASKPRQITINVNGTDKPQATADAVNLKLQGALL